MINEILDLIKQRRTSHRLGEGLGNSKKRKLNSTTNKHLSKSSKTAKTKNYKLGKYLHTPIITTKKHLQRIKFHFSWISQSFSPMYLFTVTQVVNCVIEKSVVKLSKPILPVSSTTPHFGAVGRIDRFFDLVRVYSY